MKMGDIIRELRLKNGMTQEELGAILGVQKSAIRKYESGLVENIPRSSILKMATLFNVKPSYLMGWEDEDTTQIQDTQEKNIVITIGRDGSYNKKRLSDDQIKALQAIIDQMPDAPGDI